MTKLSASMGAIAFASLAFWACAHFCSREMICFSTLSPV